MSGKWILLGMEAHYPEVPRRLHEGFACENFFHGVWRPYKRVLLLFWRCSKHVGPHTLKRLSSKRTTPAATASAAKAVVHRMVWEERRGLAMHSHGRTGYVKPPNDETPNLIP